MGRIIDGVALRVGLAIGAYLLFLTAWRSVPLACALTLACAGCAAALPRRRSRERRQTAREKLLRLACLDDAEATQILEPLLRERFPEAPFELCPILRHPMAALTAGDVLALWKARRGAERLAIAATCRADAGARAFARRLSHPAVAILDGDALRPVLAGWRPAPEPPAAKPAPPARLRRLASDALRRPLPVKLALLGPGMLCLYLLQGSPLYLFGGVWICFRWAAPKLCGNAPGRLFE